MVAETEHKVVGMGSLVVMWQDLAEIRSLVIDPNYQGQGLGREIVAMLLEEAKLLKLPRVFALTRKPGFFMKMGFQLTKIEKLPRKVVHDCVFCPKFHSCDEVALQIWFNGAASQQDDVPETQTHQNGSEPYPVISLTPKSF